MSITRTGSSYMYDRTINNIAKQQGQLSDQMEHASAGKRVIRASDDPVAAAQAERARTRLTRIETDQRQLDAQTNTIQYAESTLGEINSAVQEFRSLIVNAGNGAYNQLQRDTLAEQLQSLRDQVLRYSNRTDSNGLPLFRGLDTQADRPFPNGKAAIQTGQPSSNEYTITNSIDGGLAFFSGRTGNGVLAVDLPRTNRGTAWADVGNIKDPNGTDLSATGDLKITFAEKDGKMTYSITYLGQRQVIDPDTGLGKVDANGAPVMKSTVLPWKNADGEEVTDMRYKSGSALEVAGMKLTITGKPEAGDVFVVTNSRQQSLFEAMDAAIHTVKTNSFSDHSTDHGSLAHGLARSLSELDTGLNRLATARGVAGDLLKQAERMGTTLQGRNEQLEGQRSKAEDIDMVDALSKLNTQQTAVSAALQSYASIQKLSLFNYMS